MGFNFAHQAQCINIIIESATGRTVNVDHAFLSTISTVIKHYGRDLNICIYYIEYDIFLFSC